MLQKTEVAYLERFANKIRKHCVVMTNRAKSSHIGSSLSMVELLTVLYCRTLRVDPVKPEAANRDRFILSKGHACTALYAVLAELGFFPVTWLDEFYMNGSHMTGRCDSHAYSWNRGLHRIVGARSLSRNWDGARGQEG